HVKDTPACFFRHRAERRIHFITVLAKGVVRIRAYIKITDAVDYGVGLLCGFDGVPQRSLAGNVDAIAVALAVHASTRSRLNRGASRGEGWATFFVAQGHALRYG